MTAGTRRIPAIDSAVARAVAQLWSRQPRTPAVTQTRSRRDWRAMLEAGSELWLDSGDIAGNARLWSPQFSGLTTNNTLLEHEVEKGLYDERLPDAATALRQADPSLTDAELVLELAFLVNVLHARALVEAFDADVSVELHTDLVRDADASYAYGRRAHELCPDRFIVKIALTPQGLLAARRLQIDGVRVSVTLGFSPRQNQLIALFARPHFVNIFLGRIDSLFERGGWHPESATHPGEAATIQSQRMLRELAGQELAAAHTRQIAASMRDGAQVPRLAGTDVLTMPVAVAEGFIAAGIDPAGIGDRTRRAAFDEGEELPDHTDVFFRAGVAGIAAARQLLARGTETLDGERIRAVLTDNHLGDLFPELDAESHARLSGDGKIPDPTRWAERVTEGSASWDGLLTEAGIAAFAADQAKLDERIRAMAT